MRNPKVVLFPVLLIFLASACASSQPITEPVAVIEAFYDALNDGDLDTAMGFVADDASFVTIARTTTTYTGTAQVQDLLQKVVERNTQHELSDLIVEGDTVTWILRAKSALGSFSGPEEAVVQGGKIVSFESRTSKWAQ
jgi:ketosteroid isomerase-like protein